MKPKTMLFPGDIHEKIEEAAPGCMSMDVHEARQALIRYLQLTKYGLAKIGCHYPQPLERLVNGLVDLEIGQTVELFEPTFIPNRPPGGIVYQRTMGLACALIYAS